MLDIIAFVVITAISVLAAVLILVFKDVLHSALAMSVVFFAVSAFFIIIDEPLLAVLQLFIMVGGITTFMFVGVASARYSEFKHSKFMLMLALTAVVLVITLVPLLNVSIANSGPNTFGLANIYTSLSSSASLFYLMLLLMFGVAFGAIMLLKRSRQ